MKAKEFKLTSLVVSIGFSVLMASCASSVATKQTQSNLESGTKWHTPTNMVYMDVFLMDKQTGQEIEAARFEAGGGMSGNLENCKKTAIEEAKKRHLQDWDYYCCGVTRDNPCVTKVK